MLGTVLQLGTCVHFSHGHLVYSITLDVRVVYSLASMQEVAFSSLLALLRLNCQLLCAARVFNKQEIRICPMLLHSIHRYRNI